jgi:hypothetical protein
MSHDLNLSSIQRSLCERHNAPFLGTDPNGMVGVSRNIKDGIFPVHGLRHPLEGLGTGWFIWAGEYSSDPDFFIPIHLRHLDEWSPDIIKYLGLAPGWRFLYAPDYEDVWEDRNLLNI